MIIAIPSDGQVVAAHFGRCEKYTMFNVANGQIINKYELPNPGHQPGFLPAFLAEKGVECIIASGMGSKAQQLFNDNNIQAILGCQGLISDVIDAYASGKLVGGDSTCDHNEHSEN